MESTRYTELKTDLEAQIIKARKDRVQRQNTKHRRIEQEIRHHEETHMENIRDRVQDVVYRRTTNHNGIEYINHGMVYIDTDTTDIDALERISKAATAVSAPSRQDLVFKQMVDQKISRLKQAK